jgi:hypothetical protein
MDEEIVQRIANLVNVLASQQQNNQQLALDISKQILEVKVIIISHLAKVLLH